MQCRHPLVYVFAPSSPTPLPQDEAWWPSSSPHHTLSRPRHRPPATAANGGPFGPGLMHVRPYSIVTLHRYHLYIVCPAPSLREEGLYRDTTIPGVSTRSWLNTGIPTTTPLAMSRILYNSFESLQHFCRSQSLRKLVINKDKIPSALRARHRVCLAFVT